MNEYMFYDIPSVCSSSTTFSVYWICKLLIFIFIIFFLHVHENIKKKFIVDI